MGEDPTFINKICQICKEEIENGDIYMTHPKHGIVCEYCPEFKDGGVEALKRTEK